MRAIERKDGIGEARAAACLHRLYQIDARRGCSVYAATHANAQGWPGPKSRKAQRELRGGLGRTASFAPRAALRRTHCGRGRLLTQPRTSATHYSRPGRPTPFRASSQLLACELLGRGLCGLLDYSREGADMSHREFAKREMGPDLSTRHAAAHRATRAGRRRPQGLRHDVARSAFRFGGVRAKASIAHAGIARSAMRAERDGNKGFRREDARRG